MSSPDITGSEYDAQSAIEALAAGGRLVRDARLHSPHPCGRFAPRGLGIRQCASATCATPIECCSHAPRQGMVIFVPSGDSSDPTRLPAFHDETFTHLSNIGLRTTVPTPPREVQQVMYRTVVRRTAPPELGRGLISDRTVLSGVREPCV